MTVTDFFKFDWKTLSIISCSVQFKVKAVQSGLSVDLLKVCLNGILLENWWMVRRC